MSEKRRALGRGLGALIPSGTVTADRPVDVFFRDQDRPAAADAPAPTDASASAEPAGQGPEVAAGAAEDLPGGDAIVGRTLQRVLREVVHQRRWRYRCKDLFPKQLVAA